VVLASRRCSGVGCDAPDHAAGAAPSIVRLYDRVESDERTKDIELFRSKTDPRILAFIGSEPWSRRSRRVALAIATKLGAEIAPDGPLQALAREPLRPPIRRSGTTPAT